MFNSMFSASVIGILICIIIFQYYYNRKLKQITKNTSRTRDTLYYVADMISKTNNEEEVYNLILDTAVELIPYASKGSILIMEDDGKFHFRAVYGYSETLKKLSLDKEEVFLYQINNFAETAIIKNPQRFDEKVIDEHKIWQLKNVEALNISCTISSPIYLNDKLVGLINVDCTKYNKTFAEDDKVLMNHIKNEFQLALKNAYIKNKLRYMANFDELTGLFNRRYFKQLFEAELEKIEKYNLQACIVFIDVDDFKYINDTYGHLMGDKALKLFSDVLRKNIRSSDIYARMSGDEFVVLFVGCNENVAELRMQEIKARLSEERLEKIKVDFSYGIYCIEKNTKLSVESIFNIADKKMYENKRKKYTRSM